MQKQQKGNRGKAENGGKATKKNRQRKSQESKAPGTILDSAESSGIRYLPLQPNSGINTELLDLQDYIFQDMSSSKALALQQKLADFKDFRQIFSSSNSHNKQKKNHYRSNQFPDLLKKIYNNN